ncbi:unnamed protein product [Adineta steineri]|uniref:Uncharacterized protein n=1 Tax=Adineta steineri TaxID=433720 RepID=A0A814EDW2_9BILA|nr:unnamed protein product [Adineta steineri]CAF3798312.1 unnamed protein product [Adineta steineri]
MIRRSKMPVCGNGIVDAGEDCDCGLNKSCISVEACCNPRTCQFYSGAECLSGTCCSGCKLLPSGYPCRESRNTCDVPEFCDGISSQCPEDDNLTDGSSCHDDGICFHGMCVGAQQQCIDLWGPDSKIAHDSCYINFNPSGSMTGHCGYDSRLNKYIPCFDNDVKCGLLHCEGGMSYPRIASSNFMISNVNTREGSFECKTISSPIHSVLVNDGSICGESSFCQNNTCIKQNIKQSCNPQKTCSGNGICTSLGLCYCNPNWKGKDCSIYDFKHHDISSFNRSLPFGPNPVSPTAFAGIATIIFLLFTLCLIISCLFRSKNRQDRQKSHELTVINHHHPQVTMNPTDIEPDRTKILTQFDHTSQSLVSTPIFPHRTPLHRSPFMTSTRSITSACTGLSYLPTDTPRSIRYTNRKASTNGIFSDSETPRTRPRRQLHHVNGGGGGSPSLHINSNHRHQQTYATLALKRQHNSNISYESSRKIYNDIDKLSTNENLRDFIQVLDSFAQEKFGDEIDLNTHTFEKNSTIASSPTETNESITIDSGYQSTKQLMNTDEYAVIVKTKRTNEKFHQRRRSYSSIDNKEQFCT